MMKNLFWAGLVACMLSVCVSWAESNDGTVTFQYGESLPTITCAPLHICDIRLKPGEVLIKANIGDSTRWVYDTSVSGTADNVATTHVIIKPMDSGLTTNMILSTDQRTYHIKLISKQSDWMPKVAFAYQKEQKQDGPNLVMAAYHEQTQTLPSVSLQALDFDYRLSGDSPDWRPLRVYSDGFKTFVEFPQSIQYAEVPVLVALGVDEKEQLVNYRMQGNFFVVDKVLDEALLISGHGRHQDKVKIQRKGGV